MSALAERSDSAVARATEILDLWRDGRTYSEVAAELDLPVDGVRTFVTILTSEEERQAHRASVISTTNQRFSDEDLIAMLKACAAEFGKTPGVARFDRWSGHFWAQLLLMRFGSWREACERAGLAPNHRPKGIGERTYSDEEHRRAYFRIKRVLQGRTVSVDAWTRNVLPSEPKEGVLRRHYGGWRDFKAAMEEAGDVDGSETRA